MIMIVAIGSLGIVLIVLMLAYLDGRFVSCKHTGSWSDIHKRLKWSFFYGEMGIERFQFRYCDTCNAYQERIISG